MQPVTLSPKDVELIYGIKEQTLANWRAKGRGPKYSKVEGKKILYRCKVIECWLDEHEHRTSDL